MADFVEMDWRTSDTPRAGRCGYHEAGIRGARIRQRSRSGNAFIEYFVLGTIILLASVAFFDGGNFLGALPSIEGAFDDASDQVVSGFLDDGSSTTGGTGGSGGGDGCEPTDPDCDENNEN